MKKGFSSLPDSPVRQDVLLIGPVRALNGCTLTLYIVHVDNRLIVALLSFIDTANDVETLPFVLTYDTTVLFDGHVPRFLRQETRSDDAFSASHFSFETAGSTNETNFCEIR